MPSNLKIIRLRDLISFKPEGDFDFSRIHKELQEIVKVPGAFIEYDVLIDTRGSELHLSITQIWEIARDLAINVHAGSPKGFSAKIAVICPTGNFDSAKFFELCSQNRGLNVHAFIAFEEMFEWISQSSTLSSDNSL